MKTTTAALSLILVSKLACPAQEPAATPPDTTPPAPVTGSITASGNVKVVKDGPGGKVMITSGSGADQKIEIIDVQGEKDAAQPAAVRFATTHQDNMPAGPRTWLGVSVTPATAELSTHLPLEEGTGLVVASVSKDSPAAGAGLQLNDILTKLDDQILIHPSQLQVLVSRKKEGEEIKLALLRKSQPQEIKVTLGKTEGTPAEAGGEVTIGDLTIRLDGNDTSPLRSVVKQLKLGQDPLGGAVWRVEADELNFTQELGAKVQESVKAHGDMIKQRVEELQKDLKEAGLPEVLKKLAEDARDAAGQASKEAKAEAIRQLEETLRKLKEE